MRNVEHGREIEKKYRVKNFGFMQTRRSLHDMYKEIDSGISTDTFYKARRNDFVRVRENTMEITVKKTDRGSTLNRLELNLKVKGSYVAANLWARAVFGKTVGFLKTSFFVYKTKKTVVSLYKTHLSDDVFLEIEVAHEDDIQAVEDELSFLGLEREYRSLFQIFFGKNNASKT